MYTHSLVLVANACHLMRMWSCMQVLKNLVNRTSRKLGKLFDRLNRRHKLIGAKSQFPRVRGQERGDIYNIMKMRDKYTPETTVRTIKSSRNV